MKDRERGVSGGAMRNSTGVLLAAFLAVVVAFIGSTIGAQRATRGIDEDAVMISRDAAPGIETLSDLRAELREMESMVIRSVSGRQPEDRVAGSRARVDALLAKALALPIDAAEASLFGKLQVELRAFDEAAERALEQARGGQRVQARATIESELRPLSDRVGSAAKDLVEYDARMAQEAAERIERARIRSNRLAWQL